MKVQDMTQRYRKFQRAWGMWYAFNNATGNADADFRLYDRSLAGADYICKCLGGANSYEINKFSIAEETTLSDSVISLIRVLDAKGDRRCRELTRKNGQVAKATGFNQVVPGGGNI